MVKALLTNRWAWAAVVAVVIASSPGCSMDPDAGDASAGVKAAKFDYTLKDMNGKDVKLADFKGKPILLNFWATWCPPCKAEIPWFIEFTEKYKDKGLVVIGVSVDDSAADIKAFADEYKINYPMLVGLGHDSLMEEYEATFAVPVSWFIRADGTVSTRAPGIHPKEWFEAQIKALF